MIKDTYSTPEVSKILKISYHYAAAYARNNNIRYIEIGNTKRYKWTYEQIQQFKEKLENPIKWHQTLKTSQNYNTLFQRLKRAIKRNDTERIIQCTKDLENFKKQTKMSNYRTSKYF